MKHIILYYLLEKMGAGEKKQDDRFKHPCKRTDPESSELGPKE